MKRTAFTFALTYTAVSLCLGAPVQAQLYLENYRAEKPGVELDMDVLNDLPPRSTGAATRPLQQPQDFPAAADTPPAVPAPKVETAPRQLHQPLFAAPIPTPAPPQQHAVPVAAPQVPAATKPAARKPYNPYLTAPAPAAPAAVRALKPVPARPPLAILPPPDLPMQADLNDVLTPPALPHRKPAVPAPALPAQISQQKVIAAPAPVRAVSAPAPAATAAAPAQNKAVLSYPPAAVQKAPVQHYARPVLPKDSTLEMPQMPPPAATPEPGPVRAAADAIAKPLPKPPIETLPEEIISEAEMDILPEKTALLPARKPAAAVNTDAETQAALSSVAATAVTPAPAVNVRTAEVPLPSPKPFVRPSLIVTDKKPPVLPRAVLKQAEVTMPISATEYEQIAENMETVPVEVAMAPPKPVHAPKATSAADMTLEFDRTSESLSEAARRKLQSIIMHMNADTNTKLQVRAYATGEDGSKSAARSKSLTRATEIRSFLMDNGIKPTRVIVRALGQETDRKPLDRVDLIFLK